MKAYNDAQEALNQLVTQRFDVDEKLKTLFDPNYFGSQGQWKILEGQCLETDVGEYVIIQFYSFSSH